MTILVRTSGQSYPKPMLGRAGPLHRYKLHLHRTSTFQGLGLPWGLVVGTDHISMEAQFG